MTTPVLTAGLLARGKHISTCARYMDINGEWSLSCIKAKAPPALRLQMMISYMVTPFVMSQLLNVLFKVLSLSTVQ